MKKGCRIDAEKSSMRQHSCKFFLRRQLTLLVYAFSLRRQLTFQAYALGLRRQLTLLVCVLGLRFWLALATYAASLRFWLAIFGFAFNYLASNCAKCFIAFGISIFCGQTSAHEPHPMHAEGCLSSGIAIIAIGARKPPSV